MEIHLYDVLAESRGMTSSAVRAAVGAGGEIDSLEGVELVAAAEDHFGVEIRDRELSSKLCSSIPRLATLVAAKLERAATSPSHRQGG